MQPLAKRQGASFHHSSCSPACSLPHHQDCHELWSKKRRRARQSGQPEEVPVPKVSRKDPTGPPITENSRPQSSPAGALPPPPGRPPSSVVTANELSGNFKINLRTELIQLDWTTFWCYIFKAYCSCDYCKKIETFINDNLWILS